MVDRVRDGRHVMDGYHTCLTGRLGQVAEKWRQMHREQDEHAHPAPVDIRSWHQPSDNEDA